MQRPASCGGCRWATGKVRLAVCSVCLTIHIFRVDTRQPRIAPLTPYTGANLGDASIQDAMIANIGRRLPGVEFSGITVKCDNFVDRHGIGAFPLFAHLQVHGTFQVSLEDPDKYDSFGLRIPVVAAVYRQIS
jgi:hypothetical protein